MATQTTNLHLTKPAYSDTADIQVINNNMDTIDSAIKETYDVDSGAAVVINGNTAPKNIAAGTYLFIKNHNLLATGGYHATTAIASGASITSSNVTKDNNGIVNGAVSALNAKITTQSIPANSDLNDYTTAGTYYSSDSTVSATLSNTPITASGFSLEVETIYTNLVQRAQFGIVMFIRGRSGSTWTDWTRVSLDRTLSIPAGSSATFQLGTSTTGSAYAGCIVFTTGYVSSTQGVFLLTRNTGNIVKTAVQDATAITISMSNTGLVTIASASTSSVYAYVIPIFGTVSV